MSAERAPQLNPAPIDRLGHPADPEQVAFAEQQNLANTPGFEHTNPDYRNSAESVSDLYTPDTARASVRTLNRVSSIAERVQGLSDRAANNLDGRRAPREVASDLRDQGQEAYDNAVESGRTQVRRMGESIRGAKTDVAANITTRKDAVKEAAQGRVENTRSMWASIKGNAELRKQDRLTKRDERQAAQLRARQERQGEKRAKQIDKDIAKAEDKAAKESFKQWRKGKKDEERSDRAEHHAQTAEAIKEQANRYAKIGKEVMKEVVLAPVDGVSYIAEQTGKGARKASERASATVDKNVARGKNYAEQKRTNHLSRKQKRAQKISHATARVAQRIQSSADRRAQVAEEIQRKTTAENMKRMGIE